MGTPTGVIGGADRRQRPGTRSACPPAGLGVPRSPGDAAQHHGTGHGTAAHQQPSPHGGRRRGELGRLLQLAARKAEPRGEAAVCR